MLAALALTAALAASPTCFQVEIIATGRSAHGSAVMPSSAPHLLIRALDRLPAWVAAQPGIRAVEIVRLEAAPAVNIIPPRAVAVAEIEIDAELSPAPAALAQLVEGLGSRVEVERSSAGCGSAG